jgi:hypothetical protein
MQFLGANNENGCNKRGEEGDKQINHYLIIKSKPIYVVTILIFTLLKLFFHDFFENIF